jgi:hypothetical protein
MDPAIQSGKEIYDFVESRLNIDPAGIIPPMPYHGYFSLHNGKEKNARHLRIFWFLMAYHYCMDNVRSGLAVATITVLNVA